MSALDRPSVRVVLACCVVGALVGSVVAVGGLGWLPSKSPGTIAFRGVNMTVAYSGAWPGLFGPVHQNACSESISTPAGIQQPNCPQNLTGGQSYDFTIFLVATPLNVSDVFVNATVVSPIPIFSYVCVYPDPQPPPAMSWNLTEPLPTGAGCGIGVLFTLPNPAPTFPAGLWFQLSMMVHVV